MADIADVDIVAQGFGPGATLSKRKAETLARRREKRGKHGTEPEEAIVDKRHADCRRFRARLEFHGGKYHGWMRQPNLCTLQEIVEDNLRPVVGQRVRVVPAGRTDAGVSALAQVIQFEAVLTGLAVADDAMERQTLAALERVLNNRLPVDVRVHSIEVVSHDFNVMSTQWKRYAYTIPGQNDDLRAFCQVHAQGADQSTETITFASIDLERMRAAAAILEGSHNFAAFQSRGGNRKGNRVALAADLTSRNGSDSLSKAAPVEIRTLYRVAVLLGSCGLAIVLEGDGFLTHMCRILAGTLLQIGMARREASSISRAFESGSRADAGPTLPAGGLCLEHVEHDHCWSRELSEGINAGSLPRGVDSLRSAQEIIVGPEVQ